MSLIPFHVAVPVPAAAVYQSPFAAVQVHTEATPQIPQPMSGVSSHVQTPVITNALAGPQGVARVPTAHQDPGT